MFPFIGFIMVRITGIEPARLMATDPKSAVSANFTISAFMPYFAYRASVPAIPTVLVSSVSAIEHRIHFNSAACCTSDRWGIALYCGESCPITLRGNRTLNPEPTDFRQLIPIKFNDIDKSAGVVRRNQTYAIVYFDSDHRLHMSC